jgi:hypothetical protein
MQQIGVPLLTPLIIQVILIITLIRINKMEVIARIEPRQLKTQAGTLLKEVRKKEAVLRKLIELVLLKRKSNKI